MSNAAEIRAELERLALEGGGRLTPEAVVQEAADPASILHTSFTWDDSEAAAKQRLFEARTLIRSVKISVTTERVTVQAPFFVRDPTADGKEQGYVTLISLRTDEEAARETVVAEFARAATALRRARAVAAALGVAERVSEIETLVQGLSAEVASQAQA